MIGRTLSHCRILAQLGSGGMGVVYRARDERLERDVALKVLPTGALADEASRKQFRREALALSKLSHPNIATVHDFDSQEGVDFLVMELVEGETLAERAASGPLPEREVTRLGEQLAEGLSAAHRAGVLHRDIKPSNLRVTSEGRLKILDFGLARLVRADGVEGATATVTETGAIAGTLPYMSPEQLRGERLDERTDVWAAGAVLYELATGRRPFVGEPQARLIAAILHDEPSGLRELNAKLTADLERIALRCLEKDPDHRYQTARDLAAELKRLQAPVSSGASRAAVPARRPAPSRPLVLGGIVVAAAVIVVAGLLVFDVGGIRQRLLPVNPATGASIAVLPLANLSGDPAQEYFADGMTDELITRLAQVSGLKVISRTSSMQYKGTGKPVAQIARELGVKLLVQGTVQRAGEQVQVRAQLVEAATDRNLWADSFQRGAGDVFEIQAEVVRGVVDRIKVNLTPDDRARLVRTQPVRAEAHEAYLRGRYAASRLNAEELGRAVEFFNQALRLEPGYAQAWAGLAGAYYGLSSTFLPANEIMPKIRAAANRAIELDPGLPEAHVLLSHVAGAYERDWKTAEKELQEAIRLGPNISEAHAAYAGSLQIRGNLDRAQTEYERALELDPLSTVLANYTVWCLYLRGRYDEAIARLDGLVRLAPDDAQTWYNLGQCYLQKREYTRAISDLQKAVDLADGPWPLGMLGYAYAVAGRTSDARAVLGRMAEAAKVSQLAPFAFASVYSGLGDRDRCFEWLEKAYAGHDENLLNLKVDPVLASVRSDPRFASLTRRIGLE